MTAIRKSDKLTLADARAIRKRKAEDSDLTHSALADEFGVNQSQITRILNNQAFREEAPAAQASSGGPATVPWNRINRSDLNPRRRFDPDKLQDLALSIASNGLLEPIVVRPVGDRFEIVAGERRHSAIELLIEAHEKGDATAADDKGVPFTVDYPVPVAVKEMDDETMLRAALVENLQRDDLTHFEEAAGYARLQDRLKWDGKTIAAELGFNNPRTVQNRLKCYRGLSDRARVAWEAQQLTTAQAEALILTDDHEIQEAVLDRILRGTITREVLVRDAIDHEIARRTPTPLEEKIEEAGDTEDDDIETLENGIKVDRHFRIVGGDGVETMKKADRRGKWLVAIAVAPTPMSGWAWGCLVEFRDTVDDQPLRLGESLSLGNTADTRAEAIDKARNRIRAETSTWTSTDRKGMVKKIRAWADDQAAQAKAREVEAEPAEDPDTTTLPNGVKVNKFGVVRGGPVTEIRKTGSDFEARIEVCEIPDEAGGWAAVGIYTIPGYGNAATLTTHLPRHPDKDTAVQAAARRLHDEYLLPRVNCEDGTLAARTAAQCLLGWAADLAGIETPAEDDDATDERRSSDETPATEASMEGNRPFPTRRTDWPDPIQFTFGASVDLGDGSAPITLVNALAAGIRAMGRADHDHQRTLALAEDAIARALAVAADLGLGDLAKKEAAQ